MIRYWGIPFHFTLYRSTANRNYIWIGLPHPSGIFGTTFPRLYEDGRIVRLVQDTEKEEHNTNY